MLNFFLKKEKKGFVVLTLVLIISATVLSVVVGTVVRSLSNLSQSTDSEKSLKAWSLVNACGEYALGQLASTTDSVGWSYSGAYSLSLGSESCYIYPIEDGLAGVKLVKASSSVSKFTKKIVIEVATNTPEIVINSWKEVADF